MDARGFPTSLPEFQQVFPNDEACAKYLETMRRPRLYLPEMPPDWETLSFSNTLVSNPTLSEVARSTLP